MTRAKNRALCTDPEWLGRSDCRNCGIRHMMMFSGLEDSDFDQLLDPIDNLRYSAGTLFYRQGDSGKTVFSVRNGLIKLTQTLADGSQRIVRLLGPGALVGLEALLDEDYRHTVVALDEVDVCRITTATLIELEKEKPWLAEKVMTHWDQHLRFADRWISELSSGTVRSRTLRLLRLLLELTGDRHNRIRFFGYEDMASMIATSRESFSRVVAELKQDGIILDTGDSRIYRIALPDS